MFRNLLVICLITWALHTSVCHAGGDNQPSTKPTSYEALGARIAELINQLGHPDFKKREKAQSELARIGLDAYDALQAAEDNPDIEVASQARYLRSRPLVIRKSDPLEVRTALEDYTSQLPTQRLERIKQLANMTSDASLEWLCRLARFEESTLLSKQAALCVLQRSVPVDKAIVTRQIALISSAVRRPAAQWLKAYVLEQTQPEQARTEWNRLIAQEERSLSQETESSPALMVALLQHQVILCDQVKRSEDSGAAIIKLMQFVRDEADAIVRLIDWLRERKAWSALAEVSKRFAGTLETEPVTVYALAQARLAEGNATLAEELARKALAIHKDKPEVHLVSASFLRSRGLLDWSDREFQQIFDITPLRDIVHVTARIHFGEDLHDRLRDVEAAATYKMLVDKIAAKDGEVVQLIKRAQGDGKPESVQARYHFYVACNALAAGDRAKQIEHLEKAIGFNPTDADVLIGLHRLPDQNTEQRDKTSKLIRAAADSFRKDIESEPEDPSPYNQFAWLIGNTEGDIDEAIQFSLRSIEIHNAGAYFDTLAHCYFRKGDYESAVKHQTEAAKLDPATQSITRQLKVFQQALADQKAKQSK